MIIEKRVLAAVCVAILIGSIFRPDHSMAQSALETVQTKLTSKAIDRIKRSPEEALRVLLTYAFKCSDNGVVTPENDAVARSIILAKNRVRYIMPLLEMDLNGNGEISRPEFDSYIRTQDPTRKVRSVEMWQSMNTDQDDVLRLEEVMTEVSKQMEANDKRSFRMPHITKEILKMDVDGNGEVTIDEIRAVVQAISK